LEDEKYSRAALEEQGATHVEGTARAKHRVETVQISESGAVGEWGQVRQSASLCPFQREEGRAVKGKRAESRGQRRTRQKEM
jgi:hypothetical protein